MGALVVVEGESDRVAVEALAARRGLDLAAAGVRVVSLGGAHRIASFLRELDPDTRVVGLCDAGEEPIFRRAFEETGAEFFVCDADLEDELIRALGVEAVEEVLRAAGDLGRFRTLQQMPQWRERPTHEQLHRFFAAGARRKGRYARLLVDALNPDRAPQPLIQVVHFASQSYQ